MQVRFEKPGKPGIEYADISINYLSGCTNGPIVCPVLADCWAHAMARRLSGRCGYRKSHPEWPTVHEKAKLRLKSKKPRRIAYNFMGDMFSVRTVYGPPHRDDDIIAALKLATEAERHRFYVLTKQPTNAKRFEEHMRDGHIWLGTSISAPCTVSKMRLDALRQIRTPEARWLSIEPLLGDIAPQLQEQGLHGIEWVVIGAKTGPHKMIPPMEWVTDIINVCIDFDIPYFLKPNLHYSPNHPQAFPCVGPTTWATTEGKIDMKGIRNACKSDTVKKLIKSFNIKLKN